MALYTLSKRMNEEFEKQIILQRENCDIDGNMKLSFLFYLCQEIAKEHTAILGCSDIDLKEKNLFWAVTNYRASINKLPKLNQSFLLKTCIGKTSHIIYPRYYMLQGFQGEIFAQIASRWVLMNREKRTAETLSLIGKDAQKNPWNLQECSAFSSLPAKEFVQFQLPDSYTDKNGHMNNVRYFDLANELLGEKLKNLCIKEAAIEYKNELRKGSFMQIGIGEEQQDNLQHFYLFGENDKKIFRMLLSYAKIEET